MKHGLRWRPTIQMPSLFVSVLTGRFSGTSDIGVVGEFRPEARIGVFRPAEIEEELSQRFGGR